MTTRLTARTSLGLSSPEHPPGGNDHSEESQSSRSAHPCSPESRGRDMTSPIIHNQLHPPHRIDTSPTIQPTYHPNFHFNEITHQPSNTFNHPSHQSSSIFNQSAHPLKWANHTAPTTNLYPPDLHPPPSLSISPYHQSNHSQLPTSQPFQPAKRAKTSMPSQSTNHLARINSSYTERDKQQLYPHQTIHQPLPRPTIPPFLQQPNQQPYSLSTRNISPSQVFPPDPTCLLYTSPSPRDRG